MLSIFDTVFLYLSIHLKSLGTRDISRTLRCTKVKLHPRFRQKQKKGTVANGFLQFHYHTISYRYNAPPPHPSSLAKKMECLSCPCGIHTNSSKQFEHEDTKGSCVEGLVIGILQDVD